MMGFFEDALVARIQAMDPVFDTALGIFPGIP
jgi:hypothetical protein